MKQIYKVIDGSWAFKIGYNELEGISGCEMQNHRYRLLADDCALPTNQEFASAPSKNDCIIKDISDETIVFTSKRFLREVKVCPHCGMELVRSII